MGAFRRRKLNAIVTEVLVMLVAIVFLIPFYLLLINSVKGVAEQLTNTAGWPSAFVWNNYSKAWNALNFPDVFLRSLLITVFSNIGLTIISALAAHRMVRMPTRFNTAVFYLFIASMAIPFQSLMLPLVQVIRELGMINSLGGIVFTYWGLGLSFSIFLFHGFVKTISYEIEEAAIIDGCGPLRVFWRIVVPLLQPMTVSLVLLNTLTFWNDFLLPNLLLTKSELHTIQTAMNAFFGEFLTRWDLALPALVLGTAPAILFFLLMQRRIIEGVAGGAVKG
ncbi:carbohydrate ABC transporter permease [Cohnella fermenti]|uniref:Carbohydrate ABC transporter permease n=1 Tax=Cohnella fermenti TaxID=2565925 RepID=A0A4V3WFY9_9BACL|nr:carbohydrate ABC transporter permease [Cohnella fermenti]